MPACCSNSFGKEGRCRREYTLLGHYPNTNSLTPVRFWLGAGCSRPSGNDHGSKARVAYVAEGLRPGWCPVRGDGAPQLLLINYDRGLTIYPN